MPLGAIGDVFQLTLRQRYFDTQVLNVFYYQQLNANNDPVNNSSVILLGAFAEDVLPAISNIQVTELAYEGIDVINLFNVEDLYSDDSVEPTAGAYVVTSVMSPFNALEFRSSRVSRAIRRGYKRFAGMDESMIEDGFLASAFVPAITAVSNAITVSIAFSGAPLGATFNPVIVKRIREVDAEGNVTYRLPEGNAEAIVADAVYSYLRLSTQNSRKTY